MTKAFSRCFIALLLVISFSGNVTLAYATDSEATASAIETAGQTPDSNLTNNETDNTSENASNQQNNGEESRDLQSSSDVTNGAFLDSENTNNIESSNTTENESANSSSKSTKALTGNGTQENPYLISTAEDLATFRDAVNGGQTDACAKLTANIDLSGTGEWTPIATNDAPYSGTFDGAGFTIDGLTINQPNNDYLGFFATIGTNGVVKNVIIGSNSSISGNMTVGGITGNNQGTISGCTNYASVNATTEECGGIAGVNNGTIELCDSLLSEGSNAKITGAENIGGIVGSNHGLIRSCNNSIPIEGVGSYLAFPIGGIAGVNSDNSATIVECTNNADVASGIYSGGIVGTVNIQDGSQLIIRNCINNGSVSDGIRTGGIVGSVNHCDGNLIIENCTNNGSISAGRQMNNAAAGIIAATATENDGSVLIKNCINNGSVTEITTAGGIICYGLDNTLIEQCMNNGTINSATYAGGIAAFNVCTINDCYSIGEIVTLSEEENAALGTLIGTNMGTYSGLVYLGSKSDLPLVGATVDGSGTAYQLNSNHTGWIDQNDTVADFSTIQAINKDLVSSTIKQVDFNVNGTIVATVYTLTGEPINEFALSGNEQVVTNALPEGTTFVKWVTTPNGTEAFDFSSGITENTTAYASLNSNQSAVPPIESSSQSSTDQPTPNNEQPNSNLPQTSDYPASVMPVIGVLAILAAMVALIAHRKLSKK